MTTPLPEAVDRPHSIEKTPAGLDHAIAQAGDWLRDHQPIIQRGQWLLVWLYAVLMIVPLFLPPPESDAHIWSNLALFAQFLFWGFWQPFVLVSIVVAGRLWCGLLCPEGALSEQASRYALGLATPQWIRWRGWPLTTFCLVTVYGQLAGVCQHPKAALTMLGALMLGAITVGLLYARSKRLWCRYLCPVSQLFAITAKLAPLSFKVDQEAWAASLKPNFAKAQAANCAPLIPVRTMRGGSDCHMCGRCSGFRNAVILARRSPNHEIVHIAGSETRPWETWMIAFGMIGLVGAAFHWPSSAWFAVMDRRAGVYAPSDGVLLIYLSAAALIFGGGVLVCVGVANRLLGPWSWGRFHHLTQCLIPVAACSVFLLFSTRTTALLGVESLGWRPETWLPGIWGVVETARFTLAGAASAWSLSLGNSIMASYAKGRWWRRIAALGAFSGAVAVCLASWVAPY